MTDVGGVVSLLSHCPTTSWPLDLTEKPTQKLNSATIGGFILSFVTQSHSNWYALAAFGTLLVRVDHKNSRETQLLTQYSELIQVYDYLFVTFDREVCTNPLCKN